MSIISTNTGDSVDIVYTIYDLDQVIVDLTGGVVTWACRISGTSTDLITKTGVLTDPTNGITTVTMDPADTATLGGTYALYGEWTSSAGKVYTFEDGSLIVETDDRT